MNPTIWHGCYDSGWGDLITPDSFSHPAKMARGLLERILAHGFFEDWWERGDLLGDCFGGVGNTGLLAAYRGLRCVSVELEPRFVALANDNYRMHAHRLERLGCPQPVILQGDSRRFDEIVGEHLAGVVASPPFSGAGTQPCHGHMGVRSEMKTGKWKSNTPEGEYGTTPGQIGSLKAGKLAAVLSSPPYAGAGEVLGNHNGIDFSKAKEGGRRMTAARKASGEDYGQSPGQIGSLPTGKLDACVSSPPYEEGLGHGGGTRNLPHDSRLTGQAMSDGYPESGGQIGQDKGENYWTACKKVYEACRRTIKPGGVLVLVVKNYVKGGKIVPLTDDTITLCESIGFTCIERIHAMLKEKTIHADLFQKEGVTTTKSRASFFRRLAEKKGSPPIDWEEVLVFKRLCESVVSVASRSSVMEVQNDAVPVPQDSAMSKDSGAPQQSLESSARSAEGK